MNTTQIIDKSRVLFTQFIKLNDSLYKGNYQVNDKLAGIYYLNFSKNITEEDFEEIQYKYLADEFYNNEDRVQWNIYLLFINSIISEDLKSKILTNDKYARKLIFQESEFLDYFELEKSNQSSLPDIVSEWKNELLALDLQEVYSNGSYKETIQNFLENTTNKEEFKSTESDISETILINRVTSIELTDNFRMFPSIRNFNFGSVNLINGANGSGKTSLLESVELLLTGKSFRNPESYENENSINGILNQSIQDSYTPINIGKYKARDNKWYNRNQQARGNNCHIAFNQFNFFNTDATYQFASSEHEDQINESLKQIILGSEYAFLRDRIQGFESRLRPELNSLDRRIIEQSELIKKYIKLVDDLKSDKSHLEIKEKIAGNIIALKYKSKLFEDNYSISNFHINEIKTEIEYIIGQNIVFNFNSLRILKSQVGEQLITVISQKDKYNERINQRIDLLDKHKSLQIKGNKIMSLLKYFVIEDIVNIKNFEGQLQQYNLTLSKLAKIKREFSKLNFDSFLKESKNLADLKNSKNEDLQIVSSERQVLEYDIKILSENFSVVEDILNKIKLLGKDFLSHNKHSKSCPLCEQQISHSELAIKLDEDFKKNIDKSILKDKSEKLSELKAKEIHLMSELKELDSLKLIVQEEIIDYETLTVKEIVSRLTSLLSEEQVVLQRKTKIETTFEQITSIGGSISEFISLKEEIGSNFKTDFSFEKSDLEKLLLELNGEIKRIDDSIEKISKENDLLLSELNKSLQLKEVIDDISKILSEIKSKNEKVNSIENSFIEIKTYLDLPDDKSISKLSKELYVLEENIKSFRDFENRQKELQRITKELENAKSFIAENTPKHNRLKKAVDLLLKLKSNDGQSVLEDYFKNNLKEIKDIFKTIHAPQEFTDLKFENKKLVLYKNKIKHSVTQISTGQRAALAISIFISLNRKLKNGPNILIFDDPITFIDDFNALSFLDFLRYFIVKENKQIFFSTANKKFSTMFKKKFEFLGEDFQEFELKR